MPAMPALPSPAPLSRSPAPNSGTGAAESLLWLCAYLPRLPLEAVGLPNDHPAAVLEEGRGHLLIGMANPAAEALGLRAGQSLAEAKALCAGLVTGRRDPARESAVLQALAEACLAFTPWVSLAHPQALLLEVQGSLNLFGGLDCLTARLAETLTGRGHAVQIAAAPAPYAGWLLASQGKTRTVLTRAALRAALGALPIDALAAEARLLERLSRAGLRTLRDVWRLPREGLVRRYGGELLEALDRAAGMWPEPLDRFHPPSRFAAAWSLPSTTAELAGYWPAVGSLVERLTTFLHAHGAAARALRLQLEHARKAPSIIALELRDASRDADYLKALLKETLERSSLPAPVHAVRLQVDRVEPWVPASRDLFERHAGREADAWPRLLERLEARLGQRAVRRLSARPDHRPERAGVFVDHWAVPELRRSKGGFAEEPEGPLSPRPLWLLPAPRLARPGLRFLPELERIESGWWDGDPVRRDYRYAVDRHGTRWWVYRDPARPGQWWLHGLGG
jgi:protein ImuB